MEPAPVAPSPAVTRGAGRARGTRPVGNGGARPPLPVTQLDAPSPFAAPSAFGERAPARSAAPPPSASSARRPEPVAAGHPNHRHPTPAARRELLAGPSAIAAARARNGGSPQRRAAQLSATRGAASPGRRAAAVQSAFAANRGSAAEAGALASRYDA